MGRPYGLLRAGFPYIKTLAMRRVTNFPVDLALGQEGADLRALPLRGRVAGPDHHAG